MDYRLNVFCRVAEEQSISAAARTLHISQPAVTQHIQHLEESLRVTLLVRARTGVTLTEAGALLLEHARRVAALEEEVMFRLRTADTPLRGRIRIGSSTTITQYYLPNVLAAFKARHPEVSVELIEGNSDAMIGALLDRRIDMGLIETHCMRRDLRVQRFFDDELAVIASPDHPLARKREASLRDLLHYPMVRREPGSGTRQCLDRALVQHGVDVRKLIVAQELPSTEAIKRTVAAGLGLGCVSRISITQELAARSLATIALKGVILRRSFSIILPLGPDPVGLRQVFIGFLTH